MSMHKDANRPGRPPSPQAAGSASRCELRPGIGLCDCCGEPKWPQVYEGYGCMICLDCLDHKRHSQNAAGERLPAKDA